MEKCVSDPSVTNVLILLNPEYKKKADEKRWSWNRNANYF